MTQSCISLNPTKSREQPWLKSAGWDSWLILAPAYLSTIGALVLQRYFPESANLPLWAWVSMVLAVDVAHVYASLFRTYLNPSAIERHKTLLISIPIACWTAGCLLYSINALLFWRALAYLAVFHFVRQQYGFMCLYSRKEPDNVRKHSWLDHVAIYTVTLYPLIYWHTTLPRNFNWFVEGDFVEWIPELSAQIGLIFYWIVVAAYCVKELLLCKNGHDFNIPKNLILIGTALSWWIGIVALNSDLAFTMTNVITHGIPYMALIWLYHNEKTPLHTPNLVSGKRSDEDSAEQTPAGARASTIARTSLRLALTYAPVFVVFLIALAYLEEGIWDGLIWHEHTTVFAPFKLLPAIQDPAVLAILIPLLSLPQSTHYVLDGFIWRVKNRQSLWSA